MADHTVLIKPNHDYNALSNGVAAARKELARLRRDVRELKAMFLRRFKEVEMLLNEKRNRQDVKNSSLVKYEIKDLAKVTESTYCGSESNTREQHRRPSCSVDDNDSANLWHNFCVIGRIKTCFKQKNGIPRQGSVCPMSRAELCIDCVREFTNPSHSLEGLEKFSHVWLLFIFHKNSNKSVRAKVRPPRLDGKKIGVFASRSPHRPSVIGLTLARLEGIKGNKLLLSGVDILDDTPVLDIKPYIPDYDCVYHASNSTNNRVFSDVVHKGLSSAQVSKSENQLFSTKEPADNTDDLLCQNNKTSEEQSFSTGKKCRNIKGPDQLCTFKEAEFQTKENVMNGSALKQSDQEATPGKDARCLSTLFVSEWITQPPITPLCVCYSEKAKQNLRKFYGSEECGEVERYHLELMQDAQDVQDAIKCVLQGDPRSVYRRNQCPNDVYHFSIDKVNVTCIFRENTVEVTDINPI